MAERRKDAEDRTLEALFRSEPIVDDGFTVKVVSRVRRRIWVRRLSLPIAIVVGALIGLKPLVQVATLLPDLLRLVPADLFKLDTLPVGDLPQVSTLLIGAAIVMAITMVGRMLEE
jgi:hypothetical protein